MKFFSLRNVRHIGMVAAAACALFFVGCTTCKNGVQAKFDPRENGFAYSNELKWDYQPDEHGMMHPHKREPEPVYYHHCFPMVRSAREFFYHAKFRPDADRVSSADYKRLIAQVTSRDSRCPSPSDQKIVIPGFSNLHEFSEAFPDLLKQGCGTVRASYFQHGNWRMVFPFTRYGQSSQSEELQEKIELGLTPIVHLTDFPTHTINHVILLYSMTEQDGRVVFNGYDPNNPPRPAELIWADHQFTFERNNYFTGGKVNVYEVYKNVLF